MEQQKQTTKAKQKNKIWPWSIVLLVVIAGAAAFGLTRLIQWSGSTADVLLIQAEESIAKGEYQSALSDLYSVTILDGVQSDEASQAYLLIGQLYETRGQLEKSLENYQAAVDANADNVEAGVSLLDLALRQNETEVLDKYLEKLVNRHQDNGAILVMQARWAWAQGISETEDLFAKVYEVASEDPFVLVYTTLYRSRTDQNFAKNAAHKLSEMSEQVDQEKWQAAFKTVTDYITVLTEVKENIPYYAALLGQVFLEIDDLKLAEVVLREAIDAEGEYRDGYILLGEALRRQGFFSAAQENIKKAIELDPIYGYSFYVYGLWAAGQENWEQAIEMMEQALTLEYTGNSIRKTIADYYYQIDKPEGIITQYEELIKADPGNFELIEEYVFMLLQFEDQYAEAKKYIDQLLQVSSRQGGLVVEAYYLYLTGGETEKITFIIDTALQAGNNNPLTYLVQGLINNDKQSLERALDLDMVGKIAVLAEQVLTDL